MACSNVRAKRTAPALHSMMLNATSHHTRATLYLSWPAPITTTAMPRFRRLSKMAFMASSLPAIELIVPTFASAIVCLPVGDLRVDYSGFLLVEIFWPDFLEQPLSDFQGEGGR